MEYITLFNRLKKAENYESDFIEIDDFAVMRNFNFSSAARDILPGGARNHDDYSYIPTNDDDYEPDVIQQLINKTDAEVTENIDFRYHVLMPKGVERSKDILLMFHGFNEKHWHKYLPWAYRIMQQTGKSIVMFPIAFHMNRAPKLWSDARAMFNISAQRKVRHPEVLQSSLSNVAISTRLHNKPQRFIWSGLQSYYDVITLLNAIKENRHPAIAPDARYDLFSYSVGSFLSEILLMTNHNDYFSQSRFVSYCGGAVFNRLTPVSKFILDSEADVSLYSFLVEHLESHLKRDKVLNTYMNGTKEGHHFQMMLNYRIDTAQREANFRAMSDRIYAVVLKDDTIIPPYEVVNTLQGTERDIPIRVDLLDYPYTYRHEDPFPAMESISEEVTKAFEDTFDRISDFLKH